MSRPQLVYNPYPVFIVDGESLELWLSNRIGKIDIDIDRKQHYFIDIDLRNLVPAQGWLIDDDEMQTAWERITPTYSGLTTIVPLLICDSDVNFSCLVFVVEQEVSDEFVSWCRFGFSMDCQQDRVGGTVKWLANQSTAKFKRSEYIEALEHFKKLCAEEWK
jgi:hypothetical protein